MSESTSSTGSTGSTDSTSSRSSTSGSAEKLDHVEESPNPINVETPKEEPQPEENIEGVEENIEEEKSEEDKKSEEKDSSSPEPPEVAIVKPTPKTFPGRDEEEEDDRRNLVTKSTLPFMNVAIEESDFHGQLTEDQRSRLVESKETLADLYKNAKNFTKKAYSTIHTKTREKTWPEFLEMVENYACGFLKHKDHKSFIISMENTEEAYAIALAAMLVGKYVSFAPPTHPNCRFASLVSMINADVAFIDNTIIDNLKEVQKQFKNLQLVVVGTDVGKDKGICSLKVYCEEKAEKQEFEEAMSQLKPDTVAEVVPVPHGHGFNGVIWTHGNICSALENNNFGFSSGMKVFEVLPQASYGERIYGLYMALKYELHVVIVSSETLQFGAAKMMELLKKEKPKFLLAVPRIYEKIAAFASEVIDKAKLITKSTKEFAARKGAEGQRNQGVGESKPKGYGLSRLLVYNKALKAIGLHKCKCACWGVMTEKSIDQCHGLGIHVSEGLMFPETVGFCLKQKKHIYVPGSYGCEIEGCEIEVRKNELVVRGPNVSCGYCNEGVHHVYPFDNGFMSGFMVNKDVCGYEEDETTFYFPRRYKHPLIVTSNSDVIDPHYMEKKLCTIPTVSKCIVIGDKRKFLAALFEVNYEDVQKELKEKCPSKETYRNDPYFGTYLRQRVDMFNQTLPKSHRIKKFVIVDLPDVTPGSKGNTKIKVRCQITNKYSKGITKMYTPITHNKNEQEEKKKLKEEEKIQKQRRKEEKQREKEMKKAKKQN